MRSSFLSCDHTQKYKEGHQPFLVVVSLPHLCRYKCTYFLRDTLYQSYPLDYCREWAPRHLLVVNINQEICLSYIGYVMVHISLTHRASSWRASSPCRCPCPAWCIPGSCLPGAQLAACRFPPALDGVVELPLWIVFSYCTHSLPHLLMAMENDNEDVWVEGAVVEHVEGACDGDAGKAGE